MTFIKLYIKLKFCVHEIYRNDACGGEDNWVHFPTNNYMYHLWSGHKYMWQFRKSKCSDKGCQVFPKDVYTFL